MSIETILSTYTHTGTHTHEHTDYTQLIMGSRELRRMKTAAQNGKHGYSFGKRNAVYAIFSQDTPAYDDISST